MEIVSDDNLILDRGVGENNDLKLIELLEVRSKTTK